MPIGGDSDVVGEVVPISLTPGPGDSGRGKRVLKSRNGAGLTELPAEVLSLLCADTTRA